MALKSTLTDILEKIPVSLFLAAYCGYLGFGYYMHMTDAESELNIKKKQIVTLVDANKKKDKTIKEVSDFAKSIEQKKVDIRKLAQDLREIKNVLPSHIDVPVFMKMVLTEAGKVGLSVTKLEPIDIVKKEYFHEQAFRLKYQGVYVELVGFFERIANLTDIVTVNSFEATATGVSSGKYAEIEGSMDVVAYMYAGSKADQIDEQKKAEAKP